MKIKDHLQGAPPVTPWLSDEEIADICWPLTQVAARRRYLERQGLHFTTKPNGDPVIMRSELERVVGAGRLSGADQNAPAGPNVVGLRTWAKGRRGHGPKTQGR